MEDKSRQRDHVESDFDASQDVQEIKAQLRDFYREMKREERRLAAERSDLDVREAGIKEQADRIEALRQELEAKQAETEAAVAELEAIREAITQETAKLTQLRESRRSLEAEHRREVRREEFSTVADPRYARLLDDRWDLWGERPPDRRSH